MAKRWREIRDDGDNIVARFMEPSDLKGITSQDVVIGPNEAAVIIKGGKIEDVITQSKQRKFGEGLLKRFKNKIFGSEDYRVLFIDTSPIDVTGKIKNVATKDNVKQDGTCMLRFQVDMNNAQNFLNLIKSKEKLTTDEIREKISNEITATVFSPYIHRYSIDEFRGDTKIQDEIEESVMTDMRKTFEMWGLNLLNLATNWDISEYEKVERKEKEAELEEKEKDIETEREKREIEREYDVKGTELDHEQDLEWKEIQYGRTKEKSGVEHQEELKDIKTDHSLERKDKQHKQKMTEEEREWEQDKKELEKALDWKEKLNEMKMEREKHETELEIDKYQETELKGKKVEADGEKTKAQTEAEKAKHNLETYKEAEDREREHRKDVMDKEAELMESAKQEVPNTLVQGTDRTSTSINTDSSAEKEGTYPNCGTSVEEAWDHCPECGDEL